MPASWKPWKPLQSRAYPYPLPPYHPDMPAEAYAWDVHGTAFAWSTWVVLQTPGGRNHGGYLISTCGSASDDLADMAFRHWDARGGPASLFSVADPLPDLWPRCQVIVRRWTLPTTTWFYDRQWMRVTRARAAVHSMIVNDVVGASSFDSAQPRRADDAFVESFQSRHASQVTWIGRCARMVDWWREESGKTLIGTVDDEWVYFESDETDVEQLRAVMFAWIARRAWQDRTWRYWTARLVGKTWARMQHAFADWEPRDSPEYWYALNWDIPRWSADDVQMIGCPTQSK